MLNGFVQRCMSRSSLSNPHTCDCYWIIVQIFTLAQCSSYCFMPSWSNPGSWIIRSFINFLFVSPDCLTPKEILSSQLLVLILNTIISNLICNSKELCKLALSLKIQTLDKNLIGLFVIVLIIIIIHDNIYYHWNISFWMSGASAVLKVKCILSIFLQQFPMINQSPKIMIHFPHFLLLSKEGIQWKIIMN